MNTQKISALEFVDLYIGEEYCDIKGLAGASASRVGAPDELKDQINALRQQCQVIYRAQQEPEFALILDGVLFRVAQIRPLATLGLAPHVMRALLEPQTRGLILIAGEMGTGKTSTAASIVVQRL